ncbi:MAG: hypothetical protein K8R88_12030 [Armatimonadetes bacterium]|nr:hypothetical protein [Armatimonadota bacterium]
MFSRTLVATLLLGSLLLSTQGCGTQEDSTKAAAEKAKAAGRQVFTVEGCQFSLPPSWTAIDVNAPDIEKVLTELDKDPKFTDITPTLYKSKGSKQFKFFAYNKDIAGAKMVGYFTILHSSVPPESTERQMINSTAEQLQTITKIKPEFTDLTFGSARGARANWKMKTIDSGEIAMTTVIAFHGEGQVVFSFTLPADVAAQYQPQIDEIINGMLF